MNAKTYQTLEFDKILTRLAGYTQNKRVADATASLTPATALYEVEQRLAETTEAVNMALRRGNPPGFLAADIAPSLSRLDMGGVLSMKELLAVENVLKVARGLQRYVEEDKHAEGGIIAGIAGNITPLREVETRISDAIISEEEMADSASAELASIRRRMKVLDSRIRDTLNEIITSQRYQKCLQEPIITMRGERFVVPVKAEHKGEVRGIVHDTSASGSTLFIEPMAVVALSNELAALAGLEKDEIERILAELSAYVGGYSGEIVQDLDCIYQLDFIFCKARLSIDMNALAPALNDEGYIDIKQGRHPLLDPARVVPIDIYLGKTFDTLVITGPNTGGKTVSLKTLGLFTLMAQSGLHIPVRDNSHICVFEQVFADIGDEQSIEQSLSTFSSHIVNLVGILGKVHDSTLVLMDELGAGTDPVEGAALAISILEYIRARGARAAATTHYSELKMYALTTDGVENASCEFDVGTLSPTYRLLIGVPGKSNAFAISTRLGMDAAIIERAKTLMHDDNVKMEDVINRLEQNRQEAERERQRAQAMERDARALKEKLEREQADTGRKRHEILEEARREALRILDDAKEEAQRAVRDIRTVRDTALELDAQREVEQAKSRLKKRSDKLAAMQGSRPSSPRHKPPKNLKPGDSIELVSLGQRASVLTKPDKDGNFQAQAGIMKVRANLRDVRLLSDAPKLERTQTRPTTSRRTGATPGLELDLRGMYLEEALQKLDKFLDDAVLSGLHTVTVIHGKGTGVLRKGVQERLKGHKHVAAYRLGQFGEGEDGVTIVELR